MGVGMKVDKGTNFENVTAKVSDNPDFFKGTQAEKNGKPMPKEVNIGRGHLGKEAKPY